MKITLPERLAGTRDALFVLEVEFPVATEERKVEVATEGAIEALDLRGTGPGGTYDVPVGLERLHVPMRVTGDQEGEAKVTVRCVAGPEQGTSEERTVLLEKAPAAASSSGARGKLVLVAALVIVLVGGAVWLGPKLFGSAQVPDVGGMHEKEAMAALQKAEYRPEVAFEDVADAKQDGVVLRTDPAAGASLAKGEKVQIVLGKMQAAMVRVDNVVGQTEQAAAAALEASGFQPMTQYQDAGPGDEPGRVLHQSPDAGTRLARGEVVTLVVARAAGTPQPETPKPETPKPETPTPETPTPETPKPETPQPETPTPETPKPETPQPETPKPETPGPERHLVEVPNLVGMSFADAEKALEKLGLLGIRESKHVDDAASDGKVLRQFPEFDAAHPEKAAPGDQVFLTVGHYEKPATPTPETPKPETPQPETPKPETPKPETPKPEVPQPETPQPGTPQPETPKPETPQPETPQPETPQPETPKPETPKPETPQPETPKPETPQPGTPKPETPTAETPMPGASAGQAPVPDLIALTRERATGLVRQAGFRYRVQLEETADVPDGQVVSQRPPAGEKLEIGGTVDLIVARAPVAAGIAVPDVVGKTREEAERALRAESFLVRATYSGGPPDKVGRVSSQDPAGGAKAGRRTWVEIVVIGGSGPERVARGGAPPSPLPGPGTEQPAPPPGPGDLERAPTTGTGPVVPPTPTPQGAAPPQPVRLPPPGSAPTQTVPDVSGQPVREAIRAVLQAGLIPITVLDRSGTAPEGTVTKSVPKAGARARAGDLVRLTVRVVPSTDERYVSLPTSLGGLVAKERQRLEGAGHQVEVVTVDVPGHPYADTERVAAQYPVSSVPRSRGRTITLWVVRSGASTH
jgi:beta-lactam-binding protein with PASTA domain